MNFNHYKSLLRITFTNKLSLIYARHTSLLIPHHFYTSYIEGSRIINLGNDVVICRDIGHPIVNNELLKIAIDDIKNTKALDSDSSLRKLAGKMSKLPPDQLKAYFEAIGTLTQK